MNHKINKYINTKLADRKWGPTNTPPKDKYDIIITIPCYNEYDYIFKIKVLEFYFGIPNLYL